MGGLYVTKFRSKTLTIAALALGVTLVQQLPAIGGTASTHGDVDCTDIQFILSAKPEEMLASLKAQVIVGNSTTNWTITDASGDVIPGHDHMAACILPTSRAGTLEIFTYGDSKYVVDVKVDAVFGSEPMKVQVTLHAPN